MSKQLFFRSIMIILSFTWIQFIDNNFLHEIYANQVYRNRTYKAYVWTANIVLHECYWFIVESLFCLVFSYRTIIIITMKQSGHIENIVLRNLDKSRGHFSMLDFGQDNRWATKKKIVAIVNARVLINFKEIHRKQIIHTEKKHTSKIIFSEFFSLIRSNRIDQRICVIVVENERKSIEK